MSEVIKIRAYEFKELNRDAQLNFAWKEMSDPFESETGEVDQEGKPIIEYDYFTEWDIEDQIEYCEMNNYLFDKRGNSIRHLEEKAK